MFQVAFQLTSLGLVSGLNDSPRNSLTAEVRARVSLMKFAEEQCLCFCVPRDVHEFFPLLQEIEKNANELITEEEREKRKLEKRRLKKKVTLRLITVLTRKLCAMCIPFRYNEGWVVQLWCFSSKELFLGKNLAAFVGISREEEKKRKSKNKRQNNRKRWVDFVCFPMTISVLRKFVSCDSSEISLCVVECSFDDNLAWNSACTTMTFSALMFASPGR